MKKKSLDSLIKLIVLLIVLTGGYTIYDTYYDADTIKIANWNLQIFGPTKASNMHLMQTYVSIIDDYDIIFIQEIRDNSRTSFSRLCSMIMNYSCMSSSRAGRTSNQEQYGIIYKNRINITSFSDYNPDFRDRWERPPIEVVFDINGKSLTVYNIHLKPEDVENEMNYLEEVVEDRGEVIVLGDLNLDCNYDDGSRGDFETWNYLITDDDDTTSSSTHCAYDRIILNNNAFEEVKDYGIHKKGITSEASDHYLVW
ncbi:MAG: endonuclease/exonuclease/phosphatase family protein, partial [Nanoarchaeota archaeon]|nr:endonuclease/exonuclease/phosphatase family protein [Nanoarchaeota archaeon]